MAMLSGIRDRITEQAGDGSLPRDIAELRILSVEKRFDNEYFEKLSRNVGYLLRNKRPPDPRGQISPTTCGNSLVDNGGLAGGKERAGGNRAGV